MNPNRFYQEKSALLTALVSQIQSCKYTLETIQRLDQTSSMGQDADVNHLVDLTEDLQKLTLHLRDAVDVLVQP